MRILLAAPVSREMGGVDTGGIVTHAWGLATALTERGHEVAFAADNRPASLGVDEVDGIRIYGVLGYPLAGHALSFIDPRMLAAMVRTKRRLGPGWKWRWVVRAVLGYRAALKDFEPDLVHVHTLEARFTLVHMTDFRHLPLVATAHSTHYTEYADEEARDDKRSLVERNLVDASHVIFVSEWVAERHEHVYPHMLDHAQKVVLPNPIDATEYHPVPRDEARARVGIPDGETLLLTLGNLVPRKDPLTFVRAVGLLRDSGVAARVIMVGEGPEKQAVETLIGELGLGETIRLEGHVPQEAINHYYTAADVYVFPSLMETWGLAAVEAMLCGCPVVGTFEVMPEVVPDFAGIYVPSHEPADLSRALGEAVTREWDRPAIREFALGYDWRSRVAGFEEFYRRALSEH